MRRLMNNFAGDASGATSVEYAVIAAGIFLAIVTTIDALGTALAALFNDVAASF